MKSLLSRLDQEVGKHPWQEYMVKHGIETYEVLIPYEQSKVFEQQVAIRDFTDSTALFELVESLGGEVQ